MPMRHETISVECYSGYKSSERPIAFIFQERRWEIAEVIDRWYEGGIKAGQPAINYYKVKTIEGNIFLLRYVSLFDAWSIQL